MHHSRNRSRLAVAMREMDHHILRLRLYDVSKLRRNPDNRYVFAGVVQDSIVAMIDVLDLHAGQGIGADLKGLHSEIRKGLCFDTMHVPNRLEVDDGVTPRM